MNKWCGVGRLSKDVELRHSQDGKTAIARTNIAVDRKIKKDGDPEADFFNLIAFGKTAEFLDKYFRKGNRIAIVGRVENDNYTDKDGRKVYGTRVIVEECEFAESKANSSTGDAKPQNKANGEAQEGFINIPDGVDEELPFN